MRFAVLAMFLSAIGAPGSGLAETISGPAAPKADAVSRVDKRRIVDEFLHLTPAQARGFRPIYEQLQAEWQVLQRQREEHIRNFGRDYEAMTDALALEYTKERLKLEEDRLRLLRHYLPRFQKILPARKLARYYQIEEKIHAAVSAETAAEIPLVQ